ncbi:MAG: hypothetical protein JOY53_12805 [Acidobacteriaceae bacterium]|nr:hypothetical protein [Acidobacteriaceae bacterium]
METAPRSTFMRVVSCLVLLLSGWAQADQIEDGAHALAAKIAAHLAPQERAHLVVRNISGLPAADAIRARSKLEAALPRRSRAKSVVDVSVTFSENIAGYLWVAEIHKGEVEMVAVSTNTVSAAPHRQLLAKRLLWEQSEPLLDVVQQVDRTVVLGNGTVTIVHADKRSDVVLDIPRVRDPRGRLEVDGNTLTAYFPGATCRGTEEPLHLDCGGSSAEFLLNGDKVRFTPGRNTIAGLRPGEETASVCEGMKLVALKEDLVTLLDKNGSTRDQIELSGQITALWPAGDGALAVMRNPETEQYAAYAISVDCASH